MAHNVFLNTWKQREDNDIGVHVVVGDERAREVGLQNLMTIERERHASFTQMWVVEGVEGIESVGILFGFYFIYRINWC